MAITGPIEDQLAIRALHDNYADAVFRRDAADWGALWADDAVWDLAGTTVNGKDSIVGLWQGAMGTFAFVGFFQRRPPAPPLEPLNRAESLGIELGRTEDSFESQRRRIGRLFRAQRYREHKNRQRGQHEPFGSARNPPAVPRLITRVELELQRFLLLQGIPGQNAGQGVVGARSPEPSGGAASSPWM